MTIKIHNKVTEEIMEFPNATEKEICWLEDALIFATQHLPMESGIEWWTERKEG